MAALLHSVQQKLQDPAIDYQSLVLGIALAVGAFESYIGSVHSSRRLYTRLWLTLSHARRHRQKPFLSSVLHPSLPSTLAPYLPADTSHDTYRKSQAYSADKLAYSSWIGRLDLLESFLLLTSLTAPLFTALGLGQVVASAFPYFGRGGEHGQWTLLKGFWDLAGKLPGASGGEIRQSLAFVALMTTLGSLLSAPKDYYKNFVLEEKHGFNKTTKGELRGASMRVHRLNARADSHLRRRPDQELRPFARSRAPHSRWCTQDHPLGRSCWHAPRCRLAHGLHVSKLGATCDDLADLDTPCSFAFQLIMIPACASDYLTAAARLH